MSKALVPATRDEAANPLPPKEKEPVSVPGRGKQPMLPPPANSADAPLPVQVPGAKPRFSKSMGAPGGAPNVAAVQGKAPTVTSSPAPAVTRPVPGQSQALAQESVQPFVQEKELAIEDAVFEMANRMRAAAKAQASQADSKSSIKQGKDANEPARADERPAQPEQDMNTNPSMMNMEGDMEADSELAPKHETEIVLGRRQLASVAFVVVAFLGIVAMLSYLIGRASGTDAAKPMAPVAMTDLPVAGGANGEAPEETEVVVEDVPTPPETASVTAAPIFASPAAGDRYLQVGSVTTGVAQLMVEGLRTEGLNAIATNSSSGQDHKVLVGPVNTEAEMSEASRTLNEMKLQWFVRN